MRNFHHDCWAGTLLPLVQKDDLFLKLQFNLQKDANHMFEIKP